MSVNDDLDRELLRALVADVAVIKSGVEDIKARDTDTEHRLRKVERWQWITAGVALASVGGSVIAVANAIPAA